MRKFFLAISPFAIATIFASETSSNLDEKPVTNSMGYFELGLGPAPLPLAVFGTGYRGQKDHHGFDASLQVSTVVIITHVKTSALYLYYFTPNLQAQFYAGGGLGISGVFHDDWHGRWNTNGFVSPEFVFGKQYTNDTGSLRFFQARLSFPSLSLSRFPKAYYFPLVILSYGVAF